MPNEPRLYTVTLSRVTIITLATKVKLSQLIKLADIGVLIGPGVRPVLEQMLRTKAGVDVAQELNLSTKKISRLKRALGIPLDPREGNSKTTVWRRAREAKNNK